MSNLERPIPFYDYKKHKTWLLMFSSGILTARVVVVLRSRSGWKVYYPGSLDDREVTALLCWWILLEICPLVCQKKTFHREVPYWRHFATNYPREVLGQASGHGVLLSIVHCRSWALEKLRVTQEPSAGEANSTAGGRKTCRHNTSK